MTTERYRAPSLAPDQRAALLDWLRAGNPLRAFVRQPGAPTLGQIWHAVEYDATLRAEIAEARRVAVELMAEDALEIAGTPSDHPDDVAHRRLQVETRKWLARCWSPAAYGDASRVTHAGDASAPVVLDDASRAARIAAILASAQGQPAPPAPDADKPAAS